MEIYTDLTVIGAHFGGYSIWEEASKKLCELPNLYVDTCFAFFALEKETALKIIRSYGADKVIFATDYPMWKQEDELEYLYSLGLSDDELEKILYKNITKILEGNKLLERA
jgi:predicted TIM-barrel fold metal-dependent hydrolase